MVSFLAAAAVAGVTAATGDVLCLPWDRSGENLLWKGERGDRGDLELAGETPWEDVEDVVVLFVDVVSAVGGSSLRRAGSD